MDMIKSNMDMIKSTGRRLSRTLSEQAFNLNKLKEFIGSERIPKEPLPERMVRRYSSVSVGETEETRSNSWVTSMFGRRRSSSSSHKSIKIKRLSKQLSIEEAEINKERLAAVGDLMRVFYDDEDDVSSDQDDLIEELHNIGYLITPKNMVSEAKTDDDLNGDSFKLKGQKKITNEDRQCFR